MPNVLIVEDDNTIYGPVKDWLTIDGFEVALLESAEDALARLKHQEFDLLIVDVGLPGIDGFEFCRTYRANGGFGRILIVSGRSNTDEKLTGLASGADDFIGKPFDVREVVARVKVLMRRTMQLTDQIIEFEDVVLNPAIHKAYRAGRELKLGPMEYALLNFFIRQPNRLFSSNDLLKTIWKGEGSVDTVRTHVKTLRKKLEQQGQSPLIRTIHGVGYCFTDEW